MLDANAVGISFALVHVSYVTCASVVHHGTLCVLIAWAPAS